MDLNQVKLCESRCRRQTVYHADDSLAQGDADMVWRWYKKKSAQRGGTEMCLIVCCVGQLMR